MLFIKSALNQLKVTSDSVSDKDGAYSSVEYYIFPFLNLLIYSLLLPQTFVSFINSPYSFISFPYCLMIGRNLILI